MISEIRKDSSYFSLQLAALARIEGEVFGIAGRRADKTLFAMQSMTVVAGGDEMDGCLGNSSVVNPVEHHITHHPPNSTNGAPLQNMYKLARSRPLVSRLRAVAVSIAL